MSANKSRFSHHARLTLLTLTAILAASCGGALPDPEKASVSMAPKGMPTRNLTGFSDALRCMDNLFLEHRKKGYKLTSTAMNDSTGKLALGVRDMLMTTVSAMSAASGAVTYIDMDQTGGSDSVNVLTEKLLSMNAMRIDMPQAYIRGSISQVDDSVMSGKKGGAITTGIIDIGASQDRSVSSITMDMLLMDMASRTNIPGIHASNMMAVTRSGQGMDAGISGGKIIKAGIQFNVSQDSAESSGQAVRTLVQLGLMELIGKWTKVPYWTCLEIEGNNPQVRAQLREWYDRMTPQDRIKFMQAGLKGSGHYQGNVDSRESDTLRSAIARYQTDRNLVPNGNISFEVYEALMQGKVNLAAMPTETPKQQDVITSANPINLRLSTEGDRTEFRVGEKLVVNLALSRGGYPYCYYRDGDGVIAQIYPNRFQADKQVQGGQPISIPPGSGFALSFSKAGVEEEVMCMASDADIGSLLPKEWLVKELTPMKVRSLDEIAKTMTERSTKMTSIKPSVQRLKVRVR
ncbi:MAG: DUF4384 domain-containing protein [Magnetococcales bacterium]|nr:DUF4384 domain-containing protein [Magnetococcales bacterium]